MSLRLCPHQRYLCSGCRCFAYSGSLLRPLFVPDNLGYSLRRMTCTLEKSKMYRITQGRHLRTHFVRVCHFPTIQQHGDYDSLKYPRNMVLSKAIGFTLAPNEPVESRTNHWCWVQFAIFPTARRRSVLAFPFIEYLATIILVRWWGSANQTQFY